MMKKLLAMLLAGTVALMLSACSTSGTGDESSTGSITTSGETESTTPETTEPTEPQEEAVQGTFREAYIGDREQGPEWFYMYDNDGSGWKELVTAESLAADNPDAGYDTYGDNWRLPYEEGDGKDNGNSADYTSFTDWDGIKADFSGNDGQTKLAVVYKASAAGTVTIGPWLYTVSTPNEDYSELVEVDKYSPNCIIQILKNNEEVLYEAETTAMDEQSASLTVEVAEGDEIYFTATSNGNAFETLVSFDTINVEFTAA
ncbi:MAG TPA: hypothetical protein H9674_08375 [Firmicutes bacterium]|nr:hypothetical protein [Bacillota bacterium]